VARAFAPLPDSDLRTIFRDSDRIRKLDQKEVQKIIRLFRNREQNKKPVVVTSLMLLLYLSIAMASHHDVYGVLAMVRK
jgi:hypothetical protein